MRSRHGARKAKVAVVHPRLGWGGSEARALQLIEALKNGYDVSLITAGPVDLARLNRYYGTGLNRDDFSVLQARLPPGLGARSGFAAVRGALVQRYCRRVARHFDLMISAYNPMDFGVAGIQFIADFSFDEQVRHELHATDFDPTSWLYKDTPIRRAYRRCCKALSGGDGVGIERNLTVANSKWSSRMWRDRYGTDSQVIYPPVKGDFPVLAFEEQENGFVFIGRISPEKRIEEIVRILARVRASGYDIHLHIAGPLDGSRYCERIRQLCRSHGSWVRLEGAVSGSAKTQLLVRHGYGISACRGEAFGVSVAELVKAGCIVFVPDSGGQVEIVERSELIYGDQADAVDRIRAVLESAEMQADLRGHLTEQGRKFSAERFRAAAGGLVADFFVARAKSSQGRSSAWTHTRGPCAAPCNRC